MFRLYCPWSITDKRKNVPPLFSMSTPTHSKLEGGPSHSNLQLPRRYDGVRTKTHKRWKPFLHEDGADILYHWVRSALVPTTLMTRSIPGGPFVHRKCVHRAHVHENFFSRTYPVFTYIASFHVHLVFAVFSRFSRAQPSWIWTVFTCFTMLGFHDPTKHCWCCFFMFFTVNSRRGGWELKT